jgi:hypothetical protein
VLAGKAVSGRVKLCRLKADAVLAALLACHKSVNIGCLAAGPAGGGSLAAMSEIAVNGGTQASVNSQVLPFAHIGVCRAVALGWQVAQLFHSPVHQGPVTDPPRGSS